jgi:hypothetical protein
MSDELSFTFSIFIGIVSGTKLQTFADLLLYI